MFSRQRGAVGELGASSSAAAGHAPVRSDLPIGTSPFLCAVDRLRQARYRAHKRGTGLSDRPRFFPDLETRIEDLRAVLDAVGSERAALVASHEGCWMASLFAATYPERTRSLALYHPWLGRSDSRLSRDSEEGMLELRERWGMCREPGPSTRSRPPKVPTSTRHSRDPAALPSLAPGRLRTCPRPNSVGRFRNSSSPEPVRSLDARPRRSGPRRSGLDGDPRGGAPAEGDPRRRPLVTVFLSFRLVAGLNERAAPPA